MHLGNSCSGDSPLWCRTRWWETGRQQGCSWYAVHESASAAASSASTSPHVHCAPMLPTLARAHPQHKPRLPRILAPDTHYRITIHAAHLLQLKSNNSSKLQQCLSVYVTRSKTKPEDYAVRIIRVERTLAINHRSGNAGSLSHIDL